MSQTVGVRDTKDRARGHLMVTRTAWTVSPPPDMRARVRRFVKP